MEWHTEYRNQFFYGYTDVCGSYDELSIYGALHNTFGIKSSGTSLFLETRIFTDSYDKLAIFGTNLLLANK